jgi:hypothetical protein
MIFPKVPELVNSKATVGVATLKKGSPILGLDCYIPFYPI